MGKLSIQVFNTYLANILSKNGKKKIPMKGNRMSMVELDVVYAGVTENQARKSGWSPEF